MPKAKKGSSKEPVAKDEVVDEEPAAPESDPEPEPAKNKKKNNLAALMADSDSEKEEEEDVDMAMFGKKKKKKDKKEKDGGKEAEPDETAMFGEKKKKKEKKDKDGDDDGEKKKKKKRGPMIGEVLEVQPVPKKDKLRVCKVRVGPCDPVQIVTSAKNVSIGGRFIVAPPGITTPGGVEVKQANVGGVDSDGMFCGPKEMGWDTDVLPDDEAVMLADEAEVGVPAPSYDEAVEAFKARRKVEAEKAAAASKAGAKKKGKKGNAAAADEEDLDALLGEFDVKIEDAPAAKKKGKKGKKQADDAEDLDAVLDEFKEAEKDAAPPASAPAAATPAPEPAKAADEPGKEEEEVVDAKTLANRKKKDKKKAKAVGGMWGDEDGASPAAAAPAEPAAVAEAEATAPAPKDAKKGGKEKKESAAVKAARERMEMQRKFDEEKAAFEAEQKRLVEEEKRRIEEEERAQAEAREKKRQAKLAKIQKQKEEGTYMSKAEKLRAQRAKELREQFGFTMAGDDDEEKEEEVKEEKKKKPVPAGKLKKKKQQAREDEEEAADAEPAAPKSPEKKPASPAVKPAQADDEDDDDDGWEKIENEEPEEPAEDAKSGDEKGSSDDEGSGSDSDSDSSSSSSGSSDAGYRAPIICIMGHVDTGKTKLLDKIRRTNVQEGEAGGITQQIGATYFPDIALQEQTTKVDKDFDIEVPGIMIIDTPGHESFNNLRARGSSLCDMAILVIDIMHGLELQTVESLELLKKRKCPFVIAMNKIDCLYQWQSKHYTSITEALKRQEEFVRDEFQKRYNNILLQLNERGLNCALYWENDDLKSTVNIIPTSALTGEGVPDLLYTLLNFAQTLLAPQIEVEEDLQCTVIEVKNIEGLGTTIDVVLVNGTLREGDTIVIAGIYQPIVTTIRALLTPQPMKEMRVKNEYVHHAKINTSMGVKICAPGLEDAIAGTELLVVGPDDDVEELKEEVAEGFDSILAEFQKEPSGVYVKASTLGSLEALLSFLKDMKIPVFDVGIGEVHKKDVKKALVMKEKAHPEYAVILAFDVSVSKEAKIQADKDEVQIMTADIIYHLFDKFKAYMEKVQESRKTETRQEVVFPVVLQIDKNCVFRKKDPLIVGCDVIGGQLRIGTPLCVPEQKNLEIGIVSGIERDHKAVQIARRGDKVCVKIEQNTAQSHLILGRHYEVSNQLYSKITRNSIDTLKAHFRDEVEKGDWELIKGMKQVFDIA